MTFFRMFEHLLPRSRAWVITQPKTLREFFEGLADAFADFKTFTDEVYSDIFPETTRELDAWESQFGLVDNGSLTTQQRRDRLAARWANEASLTRVYIEDTLNDAGFAVTVNESFTGAPSAVPPTIIDPRLYIANPGGDGLTECGEPNGECGEAFMECGEFIVPLVNGILLVNKTGLSVNPPPIQPVVPNDPGKWPYFLYISDAVFPAFVNIPATRQEEFESLLLQIRPNHVWMGLLVNYV